MYRRFCLIAAAFAGAAQTEAQLKDVVMVAAGARFSLAVRGDGTVCSWGDNGSGQLGNGNTTDSHVPVRVRGLRGVVAVAGSVSHSLALKSNGTVWAWGGNTSGVLGNGSNKDSSVPVQVVGLTRVVAIATGDSHSLALKSDGTVWAWGSNTSNEFDGDTRKSSNVPVHVERLTDVVAIAGGLSQSLALRRNGTVWSWEGDRASSPKPVRGLSGVVAIACRFQHSLALKSDGTLWTWGDNSYGALGNGNAFTIVPNPPPGLVSTLSGVASVSGGSSHSLALKSNGTVWAWGKNSEGQLGNGRSEGSQNDYAMPPPAMVSGLTDVIVISAGRDHGLALKSDGTVWAWGDNDNGQLGNRSTKLSNVPVPVRALAGARTATAGIPRLSIEPAKINFGASASQSITLANVSRTTLVVRKVVLTGMHPGDFQVGGACSGKALPPDESCSMSVTYEPRATSNRSAALLVMTNAPGSPMVVPLTGTNPENPCSYTASPEGVYPASPGGIYSFELFTDATCRWTVIGIPGWFTMGTLSGTGPKKFDMNIAPNSGPPRSTSIRINETLVVISQSGGDRR